MPINKEIADGNFKSEDFVLTVNRYVDGRNAIGGQISQKVLDCCLPNIIGMFLSMIEKAPIGWVNDNLVNIIEDISALKSIAKRVSHGVLSQELLSKLTKISNDCRQEILKNMQELAVRKASESKGEVVEIKAEMDQRQLCC